MNYILFNPKANNDNGEKSAEIAKENLSKRFGKLELVNLIDLDKAKFISKLTSDDNVVLVGGDGTLNHVANELQDTDIPCNLYLYKAGTGNDFLNDIKDKVDSDNLALINEYIKNLPYAIVND